MYLQSSHYNIFSEDVVTRIVEYLCNLAWIKKKYLDTHLYFRDFKQKHYENMPIQIYRKFHFQKMKIFR